MNTKIADIFCSSEIKSNTCPYCGGKYELKFGGCETRCADSERLKNLINELGDYDEY